MTQAQAHGALLGFLQRSQAQGAKVVLLITGKGVRGDGERGVLKRQVPMWLRLPEFRDMVVGFETAGIGHGGDGAIYVTGDVENVLYRLTRPDAPDAKGMPAK